MDPTYIIAGILLTLSGGFIGCFGAAGKRGGGGGKRRKGSVVIGNGAGVAIGAGAVGMEGGTGVEGVGGREGREGREGAAGGKGGRGVMVGAMVVGLMGGGICLVLILSYG